MLAIAYVICKAIIASRFGKVLVAIRDAESRTRFLGYRVENYKLVVWTLSACLAGIAGALYVPQVGIINPGEFAPENSIEVVIWVAVGGRGLLVGPIVGALLVNFAKTWFTTGALAPYWLFALGGLFIAVTLFLPKGIVGTIADGWSAMAQRRSSAAAEEGISPADDRRPAGRRTQALGGGVGAMHERARNSLLYLDGVSVSFDGFKALNELSLVVEAGRDARDHRAERRRQDDDDGRRHRQDQARLRRDLFQRHRRPHAARRGVDRPARHRPEVPEADGVREPHRPRQSRPCAGRPARRRLRRLFGQETPAARERIEELLALIRLDAQRNRKAAYLSHGQKQWLEIGMLLAQEPKLLLVDEPAAGMTDAETAATADLLRDIAKEKSVIVVEHDMTFIRALDVKVTVLNEGSVLSEGTLDHVSADPRVVESYLGR